MVASLPVSLERSVVWLLDGITAFVLSRASTMASAASHRVAVTRLSIQRVELATHAGSERAAIEITPPASVSLLHSVMLL